MRQPLLGTCSTRAIKHSNHHVSPDLELHEALQLEYWQAHGQLILCLLAFCRGKDGLGSYCSRPRERHHANRAALLLRPVLGRAARTEIQQSLGSLLQAMLWFAATRSNSVLLNIA